MSPSVCSTKDDRGSEQDAEIMELKASLQYFKVFRQKGNKIQKDTYKQMLRFIHNRNRVEPNLYINKEEIKLFNLVKVVLDGGWVFDEPTVDQGLELSGIRPIADHYYMKMES